MFLETRSLIIKKLEKVYLFLCLCMNKAKLKREKKDLRIKEENELLREDYMRCLIILKEIYEKGELILNEKVIEKL